MWEWIVNPWPWYVSGVMIGLMVPMLLIFGNKVFGISSSMRHICSAVLPQSSDFFKYDWKKFIWNLTFVGGIAIGAFIATNFMSTGADIKLSPKTVAELQALGINDFSGMMPKEVFSWENLFKGNGYLFIIIGGFMVGFGTRYAGGCTSGHAISGNSNLQWPSLVASIFFLIGGFITTHLIYPFIF